MRPSAVAMLSLAAAQALLLACSAAQPDGEVAAVAPPARIAAAAAAWPEGASTAGFVPASAGRAPARPLPSRFVGRSPRSARDLAGLTDGQLIAVMGEPDLRRVEEGSEAWLYRSPLCLLDVFLESDSPGEEPRVVLATARPAGTTLLAEEACLRALARTRAGLRPPFQP